MSDTFAKMPIASITSCLFWRVTGRETIADWRDARICRVCKHVMSYWGWKHIRVDHVFCANYHTRCGRPQWGSGIYIIGLEYIFVSSLLSLLYFPFVWKQNKFKRFILMNWCLFLGYKSIINCIMQNSY